MKFDLHQFDSYREGNRYEVKKTKGGLPSCLWDTYSAFANCYGGIIILGVAENTDGSWYTTGLTNEAKLIKDFWDTINNKNKVSANILTDQDIQVYTLQNKDIIITIHVPMAKREQKPVYINNDIFHGTFRRNWEGDYHCDRSEVLAMLRDEPEFSNDMKILDTQSMDSLSLETLHGYRNRHISYRASHPWENLDDMKYLERIGAAAMSERDNKLHPTAAGLLMFGEEYKIVRIFPEYFLDYRENLDPTIRWTDRLHSSSGDWSGNLFDFYFRVYNKLTRDLKIPFKLEGGNRIDDTSIHKALREALANCLVNADFHVKQGIVIKKEPDSIVMENPGYIRTGKYQMLKGGISDPRNKALMKMFNMIGIGERAGSGVPDIFSVWEEEGFEEPVVEERFGPDRTILTLSLIKKSAIKISDKKPAIKISDKNQTTQTATYSEKTKAQFQEILQFMQPEREYKTTEIAEAIERKPARTRELLKMMTENEMLTASGTNRNRIYKKKI